MKMKHLSLKNIKGEEWKDIPSYEGLYQASTFGRIKSLYRITKGKRCDRPFSELILKQRSGGWKNYLGIRLYKNGCHKTYLTHRIIARTFIPNPQNKPQINHKNGIKTDNKFENLEWATARENSLHAYRILGIISGRKGKTGNIGRLCKLSIPICQYDMNNIKIKKWDSLADAARFLKKSGSGICSALKGKSKYAYGYKWKYAA